MERFKLSIDNTIYMIEFLSSRKIDKEKLSSLSEAEKIRELEKEKSLNRRIETILSKKFEETGVQEKMKEMNFMLEEIAEKMDQMMILQQSNSRQKTSPSVRKMKVKEMITLLLQQHDVLSAPQLCNLLNLSRTRCSEYLKELEKEEKVGSETINRKKYFKLRK